MWDMLGVRCWRIHIGAHKTATTHLQDLLAKNSDEIQQNGMQYVTRKAIRQSKIRMKPGRMDWRLAFGGRPMINYLKNRFDPILNGSDCVVLSDENILGSPRELLCLPIYPRANRRIKTLSVLNYNADVYVYLSIRRFDEIVTSAYAQEIRNYPVAGGFEPIKDQVIMHIPYWSDFVSRLVKIVPENRLKIWKFEDFIQDPDTIVQKFLGLKLTHFENVAIPHSTRTPSWEAIKEIETKSNFSDVQKYRQEVQDIIQQDDGVTKFSPFNDSSRKQIFSIYEQDIDILRKRFPGMLIESER